MLDGVSDATVYAFLFASAYIENIMPIAPGDTVVVFGAYLAGSGRLDAGFTYVVTTAGSFAGFMTIFALGYKLGRPYFERKNFRWFSIQSLDRVQLWFERYGALVILANRFLSGTRAFISLFAGLGRMSPARVAGLALLSCAVWNAILISGGVYLGRNWRLMTSLVSRYNNIVFAVVVAVVIAWFLVRRVRRRRAAVAGRSPE